MASKNDLNSREMESYIDTGNEKQAKITLSGTPGTLTKVYLPSDAKGFRLYCTDEIRFAINKDVEVVATSSSASITSDLFSNGNTVQDSVQDVRLLPPQVKTKSSDTERYLSLAGDTGSEVVLVEVF